MVYVTSFLIYLCVDVCHRLYNTPYSFYTYPSSGEYTAKQDYTGKLWKYIWTIFVYTFDIIVFNFLPSYKLKIPIESKNLFCNLWLFSVQLNIISWDIVCPVWNNKKTLMQNLDADFCLFRARATVLNFNFVPNTKKVLFCLEKKRISQLIFCVCLWAQSTLVFINTYLCLTKLLSIIMWNIGLIFHISILIFFFNSCNLFTLNILIYM